MGHAQDGGNNRGCRFMSGQEADLRAVRGLKKSRRLFLCPQRDPPCQGHFSHMHA